jgi:hypothetical protein
VEEILNERGKNKKEIKNINEENKIKDLINQ